MIVTRCLVCALAAGIGCDSKAGNLSDTDGGQDRDGAADNHDARATVDGMVGADSAVITTSKTQIQYIVTAHPDDEAVSWSMIGKASANYPVFAIMTRGEQTGTCDSLATYEATLGDGTPSGELAPQPPPQGRWSIECEQARLNSWHVFLDKMAGYDATLDSAAQMQYRGRIALGSAGAAPSRNDNGTTKSTAYVDLWVGSNGARAAFDLGDGDLTRQEVTWAIGALRSLRQAQFPLTSEYGVLGASYYNSLYEGCWKYEHADHRAVHESLWNDDHGVTLQWGRTCYSDPDVSRTDTIDNDTWNQMVKVESNGYRSGAFQQAYGWLWPNYWGYSADNHDNPLDKTQHHWARQF